MSIKHQNQISTKLLINAELIPVKNTRLLFKKTCTFCYDKFIPQPMLHYFIGGAEEDRTLDPLRARQVLSQLSYDPF